MSATFSFDCNVFPSSVRMFIAKAKELERQQVVARREEWANRDTFDPYFSDLTRLLLAGEKYLVATTTPDPDGLAVAISASRADGWYSILMDQPLPDGWRDEPASPLRRGWHSRKFVDTLNVKRRRIDQQGHTQ